MNNYIAIFNQTYDPYRIINWTINYEINTISTAIYKSELIIAEWIVGIKFFKI